MTISSLLLPLSLQNSEQKMKDNKGNGLLPLKICRRLFSFIINNFVPRGLRRMTTCHSLRQASMTVPLVAANLNNKVQVHYNKNDSFLLNDKIQEHEEENLAQATASSSAFDAGSWVQTKEVELISTNTVQESGRQEELSVRDVEEEERIRKMKGKSVGTEEETRFPNPPLRRRQLRPLFDVAVNINEKSDAFIRSRKEAMRRNYLFETKTF